VISITFSSSSRLDINYTLVSSLIYKEANNLCLSIRSLSVMNVVMWERSAVDNYIFRCVEVYQFNTIIITDFVETSIFAVKSRNRILYGTYGTDQIDSFVSHGNILSLVTS
jgi:hypothetical protein